MSSRSAQTLFRNSVISKIWVVLIIFVSTSTWVETWPLLRVPQDPGVQAGGQAQASLASVADNQIHPTSTEEFKTVEIMSLHEGWFLRSELRKLDDFLFVNDILYILQFTVSQKTQNHSIKPDFVEFLQKCQHVLPEVRVSYPTWFNVAIYNIQSKNLSCPACVISTLRPYLKSPNSRRQRKLPPKMICSKPTATPSETALPEPAWPISKNTWEFSTQWRAIVSPINDVFQYTLHASGQVSDNSSIVWVQDHRRRRCKRQNLQAEN